MMLNNPFCRGLPGRRHVREPMRLENQGEGTVYYWRCPCCHRTADIFEREPIESDLAIRDQVAIIVAGETAERLRDWQGPYMIRFEHGERPYTGSLTVRQAA